MRWLQQTGQARKINNNISAYTRIKGKEQAQHPKPALPMLCTQARKGCACPALTKTRMWLHIFESQRCRSEGSGTAAALPTCQVSEADKEWNACISTMMRREGMHEDSGHRKHTSTTHASLDRQCHNGPHPVVLSVQAAELARVVAIFEALRKLQPTCL